MADDKLQNSFEQAFSALISVTLRNFEKTGSVNLDTLVNDLSATWMEKQRKSGDPLDDAEKGIKLQTIPTSSKQTLPAASGSKAIVSNTEDATVNVLPSSENAEISTEEYLKNLMARFGEGATLGGVASYMRNHRSSDPFDYAERGVELRLMSASNVQSIPEVSSSNPIDLVTQAAAADDIPPPPPDAVEWMTTVGNRLSTFGRWLVSEQASFQGLAVGVPTGIIGAGLTRVPGHAAALASTTLNSVGWGLVGYCVLRAYCDTFRPTLGEGELGEGEEPTERQLAEVDAKRIERIAKAKPLQPVVQAFLLTRTDMPEEDKEEILSYSRMLDERYAKVEKVLQSEDWASLPTLHDTALDDEVETLRKSKNADGAAAEAVANKIKLNATALLESYKAFSATIELVSGDKRGATKDVRQTLEEVIVTTFSKDEARDHRVLHMFPFTHEALGKCVEGNARSALNTLRDNLRDFGLPPRSSNVNLFNYYARQFIEAAMGEIKSQAPALFEGYVDDVIGHFEPTHDREHNLVNELRNVRQVRTTLNTHFQDGIFDANLSALKKKMKTIATAVQRLATGDRPEAAEVLKEFATKEGLSQEALPTLSEFLVQHMEWRAQMLNNSPEIKRLQAAAKGEFETAEKDINALPDGAENYDAKHDEWIAKRKAWRDIEPDETEAEISAEKDAPELAKLVKEKTDSFISALSSYPELGRGDQPVDYNLRIGLSSLPTPAEGNFELAVDVTMVRTDATGVEQCFLEIGSTEPDQPVTIVRTTQAEWLAIPGNGIKLSEGRKFVLTVQSDGAITSVAQREKDLFDHHAREYREYVISNLERLRPDLFVGRLPNVKYGRIEDTHILSVNKQWITKKLDRIFADGMPAVLFADDMPAVLPEDINEMPTVIGEITGILNDLAVGNRQRAQESITSSPLSDADKFLTLEEHLCKQDDWNAYITKTHVAPVAGPSTSTLAGSNISAEAKELTKLYLGARRVLGRVKEKDYKLLVGVESMGLTDTKKLTLQFCGQEGNVCCLEKITTSPDGSKKTFVGISEKRLRELTGGKLIDKQIPERLKFSVEMVGQYIKFVPMAVAPESQDRRKGKEVPRHS